MRITKRHHSKANYLPSPNNLRIVFCDLIFEEQIFRISFHLSAFVYGPVVVNVRESDVFDVIEMKHLF